ncbi:hypothetical protein [Chlamydia buteonis]|uniref:Inclusion membrane protein n=1 Tax=Chlamydia buteonis TaxID=2494525 RepID=A0ABX8L9C1_9CHLA|nr:hypothetical protein [Chlamydia buteonis]QXE27161.1 hypothetical protein HBN95_03355 [Chlamydia buteonis]QXE27917.1 hypothetical protein JJJ19_04845 [Chlamydia buteonis]
MISPTLENTSFIGRLPNKAANFVHSTIFSRIISVALITLAIIATVGSCVAMILTLNLWFALLSVVGGILLALGIMSIFTWTVKQQAERIP